MAGILSPPDFEIHAGGTCANADCALYHDPDTNPQHEYYPLAPMDLTHHLGGTHVALRQFRSRARSRFRVAVNPLTGARKRYDGAGQEVLE